MSQKKLSTNFDEIFRGIWCVTSNYKRLDFGDDPNRDTDPGIFKGIFTTADRTVLWNFLTTQEVVDEFLRVLLRVGCLTSNKRFDLGADPDRDSDPEIF